MSFTASVTAPAQEWRLVASGPGDCFLQLQDPGPVEVYFGEDTPTWVEPRSKGALLDAQGLLEITFNGMVAADKVYIASRHAETNGVLVIGSGVAPV